MCVCVCVCVLWLVSLFVITFLTVYLKWHCFKLIWLFITFSSSVSPDPFSWSVCEQISPALLCEPEHCLDAGTGGETQCDWVTDGDVKLCVCVCVCVTLLTAEPSAAPREDFRLFQRGENEGRLMLTWLIWSDLINTCCSVLQVRMQITSKMHMLCVCDWVSPVLVNIIQLVWHD